MARSARTVSASGIYHVVLRGINRQLIFEDDEDCLQFLMLLAEVKKASKLKLFAYCLMGNHVHLLVKESDEPLSITFRRLGARYVYWFNTKYGRSGHLFQDRFKSEAVETEAYLVNVLMYIYQNPVKAGLCDHPDGYRWSSRKDLGINTLVDEAELFEYIPLESIKELEVDIVDICTLEPEDTPKKGITDGEALILIKASSGSGSIAGFQALDRAEQARVYAELNRSGVSVRQFARLTGLSKGAVERLTRRL